MGIGDQPDLRGEDWHCAHCGEPSGMQGHFTVQAVADGICPATVKCLVLGEFSGFACRPGHTCLATVAARTL